MDTYESWMYNEPESSPEECSMTDDLFNNSFTEIAITETMSRIQRGNYIRGYNYADTHILKGGSIRPLDGRRNHFADGFNDALGAFMQRQILARTG